jgi:hypothetical protein|tara:strand:- start:5178 stop:5429 length:252 start_codon:yes stop_codon:yes gene_type:complete
MPTQSSLRAPSSRDERRHAAAIDRARCVSTARARARVSIAVAVAVEASSANDEGWRRADDETIDDDARDDGGRARVRVRTAVR